MHNVKDLRRRGAASRSVSSDFTRWRVPAIEMAEKQIIEPVGPRRSRAIYRHNATYFQRSFGDDLPIVANDHDQFAITIPEG